MEIIQNIKCSMIKAGVNDRTVFNHNALVELADSIKEHGLGQPITVREVDGFYQIVAGERRFRAIFHILKQDTIAAIVRVLTDEQAAAIMLAENTARTDLDPIDEGNAYVKNMTQYKWSVETTAKNAGVSTQRIYTCLKLLGLRLDLQALVRTGDLLVGYALIIAHAELDLNRQIIAFRDLRENASPTRTWFRKVVNQLKEQQAQASMFDLELLTVQQALAAQPKEIRLPPLPSTHRAPRTGSNIVQVCQRQAAFWDKAAAAWSALGKTAMTRECQAASVTLMALVGMEM